MDTPLPPSSGAPLGRSVAACLASILEIEASEVPAADDHPEPWKAWRNWLAQRGMGLVPISDPAEFNWPGPWLALLRSAEGDGLVGAVAFGAPPGVAWHPLGGPETFDDLEGGYLIAPADVALWSPTENRGDRSGGTVEAVLVAAEAEGEMTAVGRTAAVAGRGLEGDRYYEQRGTFSDAHDRGHDLTLIEAEALEAFEIPGGPITAEDARRNVVTRGIDLNALVGKPFRVGDVECFGQRLCEPCAHLEKLTAAAGKPGTLREMIHRGGLRADVVGDGTIGPGDPIVAG